MGFFNRNKGKDDEGEFGEEEPQVDIFTPQMLVKRLLWDIVPCPDVPGMIPLMKLTPDSPDVSEMEHRASHERLNEVRPVKEMLDLLVPLVSGITASAMLVNSGISADEETAVALQRHHSSVLRAGVVAILANLFDMGIITYAEGVQFGEQLLG
ncbi:hypothetical protein [Streptomyces sp. NPDC091879]|jgi:hypothetical protein|uniref:hypothetical protein n=1 Tax=Streptomyces sp. NPDC091879 TaxID=3366006 RepID=UPI003814A7B8